MQVAGRVLVTVLATLSRARTIVASDMSRARVREDGVRIQHDPHAPGMAEKYGQAGETDPEGFDPYRDTVGPGIYGGNVKRGSDGKPVIGRQYQGHNPVDGPVYDGTGYTRMSRAIQSGPEAVAALLDAEPDLVNEISTGGATPLHICGMSRSGQRATAVIIERGGQIEAADTYGYRPLHRMASNNLAEGAEALLRAGADVAAPTSESRVRRETPMSIAFASHAFDVVRVLRKHGATSH